MSEQNRYGGQAVIEGVMMRGRKHFAVACRRLSGEMIVQREPVPSFLRAEGWLRWPFVRGVVALVDAMVLGIKTLLFSANLAMEDVATDGKSGDGEEQKPASGQKVAEIAVPVAMVLGMLLAVGLFKFVPLLITTGLAKHFKIEGNVNNVIDGVLRMGLFIGYIAVIGRLKDIQRVFQFHGAEHKTIHAYEAKVPLTVHEVQKFTTRHQRCGTAFILLVLMIQMLLLLFTGWKWSFLAKLAIRLALLIPVAGISFEIIRLAGAHKDSKFWGLIIAPGMWMQRLTTREPDDSMVEVAIAALQGVLEQEAEDNSRSQVSPDAEELS